MIGFVLVGWNEDEWSLYRQLQRMAELPRSTDATNFPYPHFHIEEEAYQTVLEAQARDRGVALGSPSLDSVIPGPRFAPSPWSRRGRFSPRPDQPQGNESMSTTNPSPLEVSHPVMTVNTADLAPAPPRSPEAKGEELYSGGTPDPKGTDEAQEREASAEAGSDPATGVGVEGELDVWEARYSKRNFLGRIAFRSLATLGAGALAYYTWANGHKEYSVLAWITLGVVALLWASLIYRMIQAHYSHYYRLTNRRLFVSTGVIHRRRDMMELLRVKDVFTRQQSLMERILGLGTVVVVPTEKELPTFYLAGVDDPKAVMDLIWHHARAERDHRSVKVDSV